MSIFCPSFGYKPRRTIIEYINKDIDASYGKMRDPENRTHSETPEAKSRVTKPDSSKPIHGNCLGNVPYPNKDTVLHLRILEVHEVYNSHH